MGPNNALPTTPMSGMHYMDKVPENSAVSVIGIGMHQFHLILALICSRHEPDEGRNKHLMDRFGDTENSTYRWIMLALIVTALLGQTFVWLGPAPLLRVIVEDLVLVDMSQRDVVEGGVSHVSREQYMFLPDGHGALRAYSGSGDPDMGGQYGWELGVKLSGI